MKILIPLSLMAITLNAHAASYSFHINNVEGANSNGPTVKLPDDSKFTPTVVEEEVQNPNKPLPIVKPQYSKAEVNETAPDRAEFPLRLSFMGSSSKHGAQKQNLGANFSLSYSILKDFGLSAFYGIHSSQSHSFGGEMELTPIRITSFGWQDWIEVSALFGATRLKGAVDKDFAHLGARVNLNMGPRYGWNIAARTNITDRSLLNYQQVDAGFHVRF